MKNEYRTGLFFMFGVLVLVFLMDFLGELPFRSNAKSVYTYFDSVGELKEGSQVKLQGLIIGKVSSIELESRKLKVVMDVRKNAPVRSDSAASIQLGSLLGTSYVNLNFGSEKEPLSDGSAPLPSVNPTELNAILTKIDSSIDSLDAALGAFSFLNDNRDKIDSIFTNLDKVTDELASSKGTLGKLINDDQLYLQTTEAATELNDILRKINSGQGTLGKLVNDDSLYYDAKNTTLKIEKGVDTLEDLAPLGTLGSILGVLTVL